MKLQFSPRHALGGYRAVALGALLVAASTLSIAAAPASRAAQPAPVLGVSQVHKVSLHAEFERLAGHVTVGPRMGIVRPRGYQSAARAAAATRAAAAVPGGSTAAGTCTEPNCDLVWHGGAVEHHPKIYVVFWGPNWNSYAGELAAANYLLSFYQGLGTSQDSWSTITSQYADNSGGPSFSGAVFGGSVVDTAAPPATVTDANLAAEAASAAAHFGIPDTSDDQVVVAAQSGTCFSDGFAGTCTPQQNWLYCAWHDATTFDNGNGTVSFTNLPYQPDAGTNCGENWINPGSSGIYDGFSMVGGHEYAEAVTDPFPASGWVDTGDNVSGGEIGDKCAWGGSGWGSSDPFGDVTLSTGTFAVQSLWDNSSAGCVMSKPAPPPPPAATSVTPGLQGGGKSATSISVPAGTTVWGDGVLTGTNAAFATGTATYDVYSDSACTALVTGGPAEPVTMTGYLPLSQPVTLSTPGTYYWKVSYSGDSKNVASVSTCGPSGAVETVQAPPPPPSPTGVSLSASGGGKSGATALSVPAGTAVTGHAVLSGQNVGSAGGHLLYYIYSGTGCNNLLASEITVVSVSKGIVPASKPVTVTKPGTYYWVASYDGDSAHAPAATPCDALKVTVTRAPVIDTTASALAKTAASASVSTTVSGDLLVAYVAGKGPGGKAQTAAVTAAGLEWTLVARSDAGRGDAEVWAARASGKLSKLKVTAKAKYAGWPVAITVVGYENAPGIGRHATAHSAKGAPAGSLFTTAANSWVFAAGDDWARAASRTTGSGQRLVHQATDSAGDTYWVQSTSAVTLKSGTKVTINDTKPATDPYNLVLVEIR